MSSQKPGERGRCVGVEQDLHATVVGLLKGTLGEGKDMMHQLSTNQLTSALAYPPESPSDRRSPGRPRES